MAEHKSSSSPPVEGAQELNASIAHENNHEDTPTLFTLDPGLGIWALVVFFILLFILKKFAWGPIISSIDEREKSIRDSIDKAKQAQNESKRIANEQNEILDAAKSDASSIIQQAKATAETMANKIKQEALDEKNRIVESGTKKVESAKSAAMASLKEDTANLSISIAENLLQETLNDERHKKFVEKAIEELKINE
jgi:F-type H+-transporting ATPase subunit b